VSATGNDADWLAERFEASRGHLRGVAYRMLGSLSEADDAVQEAWLHMSRDMSRAVPGRVENLTGWLTTVVARVCLDMLRSRRSRREQPLPDPVVSAGDGPDPEQEILLADSVGLALLVVLETLEPVERLAFVLHDMFGVPFDEIAGVVGRSPAAARQLASRARRRVHVGQTAPDVDVARQRELVDAFLAAARHGDLEALIAVLAPDVVLRADRAGRLIEVRGPRTVAERALSFSSYAEHARPALVNGTAGLVVAEGGHPISIMAFVVRRARIVEIDILADPARLAGLTRSGLDA
jgi:RNA polymerase sigma-70 factor (ECF subfamily)